MRILDPGIFILSTLSMLLSKHTVTQPTLEAGKAVLNDMLSNHEAAILQGI